MKRKKITAVLLTALIAVCMCTTVFAGDSDTAGNYCEAGNVATIPGDAVRSAFLAGQSVNATNGNAIGSLYAAGQEVSVIGTSVGESLYVGGNSVTVSGCTVDGNVFAAGNNVVVGNGVESAAVYAVGNMLTFEGNADYAYIAGNHVSFGGKVDGDVTIEAESVEIEDGAEITGELKVISADEPDMDDDAKIGSFSFEQVTDDADDADDAVSKVGFGALVIKKLTKCLYWVVAMVAFGMLLVWLFDKHLTQAALWMKERPGAMIGTGIISWMCIPVAAVLVMCSYILAPLGGILLLAYVLLLCVGLAFAGASLVRLFLPDMNVFLSALIGIAALEVVRMIPVIGFVVGVAADMYLLAYVVQSVWQGRLKKKENKPATVQTQNVE